MQTIIGVYEAKTHLPALIKRVEQGEEFSIRRHGMPVAQLLPATRTEEQQARIQKAIEGLIEFSKAHRLDGLSIREMIDEGRP